MLPAMMRGFTLLSLWLLLSAFVVMFQVMAGGEAFFPNTAANRDWFEKATWTMHDVLHFSDV